MAVPRPGWDPASFAASDSARVWSELEMEVRLAHEVMPRASLHMLDATS